VLWRAELCGLIIDSNGGVVGGEVFAFADFVEPYGGSGSVQFPLDVLVVSSWFLIYLLRVYNLRCKCRLQNIVLISDESYTSSLSSLLPLVT